MQSTTLARPSAGYWMLRVGAAIALLMTLAFGTSGGASAEPTCAHFMGIANHGQHVVGDYVTGTGHDALVWPPGGRDVGQTIAGSGAAEPGAPGAHGHMPAEIAPGASFCNPQSQSPGFHVDP